MHHDPSSAPTLLEALSVASTTPPHVINAALSPNGDTPLWRKQDLDGPSADLLPMWPRVGVAGFRQAICNSSFPCPFASSSERKGRLLYAFVDSLEGEDNIAHLEQGIASFLNHIERLPQTEADDTVLIVLVKPPSVPCTLEDYARNASTLLSALHHRDTLPWPEDVPTDPDDPRWSYALAGRALFVNISTPANIARRSRNVGPCLALIISPRDVFDRVAGPDERGQRIRNKIRERTSIYDGLPFAPWSAARYGDGGAGSERKQYLLADDNEHPIDLLLTPKPAAACPFHRKSG